MTRKCGKPDPPEIDGAWLLKVLFFIGIICMLRFGCEKYVNTKQLSEILVTQ